MQRLQHLCILAAMTGATAIACVQAAIGGAAPEEIVLADGGRTDYKIVLAEPASPSARHGAEELQSFLEQICGARLPIVTDREPRQAREIILGNNAHFKDLGTAVDFASLGPEGYVVRTVGESLVIAGGELRGNLYGVYGFLEDHLGCRWFAPGVSRIPKSARLAIGSIDDRQVPALEYREPFVGDCFDGDWHARNRMNSSRANLEERHGGRVEIQGLAHTFEWLVRVDEHFERHPEYFALVDGKRRKEHPQLCCTNPDVMRLCTEAVRKLMREKPHGMAFSVSQNDWDNHCECEKCQALAKQEDSQMGPVLQLVNHVAAGIEKEFPDKIVQTLAYQWTRKPPKTIRPRPNVVVMLCAIECCFSHPLATCDGAATNAFRDDLAAWAKIASRLWVWDYTSNFAYYLSPFPNQRVRGPNVRFYLAHNVKGIFAEDADETINSELWALGQYMTAKFLWNANYDADRAMNEFLDAYYGKAARPIRTYIDLLHDRVDREHIHVDIWAKNDSPHLTDELLTKADQLWQEAEGLVMQEPELLERVRLSRMSIDYAIVERARLQAQKALPENRMLAQLAIQRLPRFRETLAGSHLTHLQGDHRLDRTAYFRELAATMESMREGIR